ncbi:MAG TPA: Ig-like domain-containing protein [Acidobacteriaceae bacterium]
MYQVFSDEFDATLTLPAGTKITAVEVEANRATRSATTSTQASTCAPPSSTGVHVCSPTQGEVLQSPVTVVAAGTGASGSVNHLELWIDGNKVGNYSGATMDATVSLPNGSHSLTVVEVDSKGADVKSSPVTFTVGATGTCSAPSSPGVHLCSPMQGESTSSPVAFMATGTGASGAVNHLELWVDGNKVGNYSGATMNASVGLAAGSHSATVIEVDTNGNYVKSAPVGFTAN